MNLSEMRRLLTEKEILLTKSLGQNFLHDANQLQRITREAQIEPTDLLLEIGPGLGPLTERLLEAGAHVHAVELDRRLSEVVAKRFEGHDRFKLTNGDGLEFLRRREVSWTDWKLVSNLPYSVASPILVELALAPNPPSRIVTTLQWEVVQRLRSTPSTRDYGVITLLVAQRYEIVSSFKIPAGCFFPQPTIDSGCIHLRLRNPAAVDDALRPTFVSLVKQAFSQRRKIMTKLLRARWSGDLIDAAFETLRFGPNTRAEELSLEQFIQLAKLLVTAPLPTSASTSTSEQTDLPDHHE